MPLFLWLLLVYFPPPKNRNKKRSIFDFKGGIKKGWYESMSFYSKILLKLSGYSKKGISEKLKRRIFLVIKCSILLQKNPELFSPGTI